MPACAKLTKNGPIDYQYDYRSGSNRKARPAAFSVLAGGRNPSRFRGFGVVKWWDYGANNPVNRVDHTGLNPSYAGIKGVHTQMALPSNIFIGGNVSDRRAIEAGIVESLSGPYGQALFDGVVDSGLPILFLRADSAELNETAGKIMSRQNRQGNTLGGKKRFRRDCQGNYHFDDDKIVILLLRLSST